MTYIRKYICTYIHTYIHTVHTYMHTACTYTYIHCTWLYTYIHTYIHTYMYIHTYIHCTYIHTYLHTYVHTINNHHYLQQTWSTELKQWLTCNYTTTIIIAKFDELIRRDTVILLFYQLPLFSQRKPLFILHNPGLFYPQMVASSWLCRVG